MNGTICVSLGEIPFGTCLQLAAAYPFVEIRLDLLKATPENIDVLALQCRRWIATCRPCCNLSERERTALLAASIRAGATYVDIEYEAPTDYRQPLLDLARQKRCKAIISYHNFEATPDDDMLEQIIKNSVEMGADLVKIAVTATASADCARIMSLYGKHSNLVAFAMSEVGRITRIAAPFVGAEFTYASVDEASRTASGQLTVSQMENLFRILG
jgi:3-dehydroquinate dehydratase type I